MTEKTVLTDQLKTKTVCPPVEDARIKAFERLLPKLKTNLEQVINPVATKLWAKGVIDETVHDQIFDTTYQGAATRSQYFMKRVYKKIKKAEKEDPSHQESKEIIKSLAEAVGEDSALSRLAETISKNNMILFV